ncbi:unnamed protein product [Lathyrus sativus]|nr:unnamed protein product [Lathyrus sativus]
MDYPMRVAGGFDEEDNDNSNNENRPSNMRFTTYQTSVLERFIEQDCHPSKEQRSQLAEEIGLEPIQVKYWFQNRRTLLKKQNSRENNSALRAENDDLLHQNIHMKKTLKAILCTTCGGSPVPSKEHELSMKKMAQQNTRLKEEVNKASSLLARYSRKEISLDEFNQCLAQTKAFARKLEVKIPPRQEIGGSSSHNHNHGMLVNEPKQIGDVEKSIISQIAYIAMNELVTLARVNEPFWMDSSNVEDEILTLSYEIYEQAFPKPNHLKSENVVKESSKYTSLVNINSMALIDMILDPVKWVKLFPTIVSKSEKIKVFEKGLMGNRDGALQLMYEQMHILSPLVRPREFSIIRYCKKVDVGVWVITDVSYDSSLREISPLARSWKHPSGCLIQEMSVDFCSVTWVEHVESDDKIHTHDLYNYLIDINNLYGAKSWVKEIQRMCEKSASFYVKRIPDRESEGVIQTIEGRKSVMKLSHRMVKMFCESLSLESKLNFQSLIEESIGGISISIDTNAREGKPNGTIICATSTLFIPLPADKVFEFLIDHTKRFKWDVLAYENPVQEIAHISNGHPGNFISIIKPSILGIENQMMILQESFKSPVGSYVIFTPTDVTSLQVAIKGEDSRGMHILSSGFVVCPSEREDGNSKVGSLLTLAYQILASSSEGTMMLSTQTVSNVNNLLTTTLVKVRDALMMM